MFDFSTTSEVHIKLIIMGPKWPPTNLSMLSAEGSMLGLDNQNTVQNQGHVLNSGLSCFKL